MNRSARLANMEGRRITLPVNHSVNHQQKRIWGILLYFVLWSSFCFDHVESSTQCTQASASFSLPVASLCYNTSASSGRVVLDGYLTYNSSMKNCECTLSSTQITTVRFAALNNLHPINGGCGSSIVVQSEGTFLGISCFIDGDYHITVSPSQPVTLNFEKPVYAYNSNYCMIMTPDNSNALLTLNCNEDLSSPTSTERPQSTSTPQPPTTTTTTLAPTTTTTPVPTTTPAPTTTTPTPVPTTTTTPAPITTTKQATTATATTMAPTTTSTTSTVSTTSMPSTGAPSTYSPTTKSPVTQLTTAKAQSVASTSSEWSYVIPAVGGGLILVIAIVMAACFNYRKNRSKMYESTNGLFAYDNKINSPYSSKNMHEDGPGMTSSLSATAQIKAVIVDDVRDDMSISTNVSEGTFIRHSVKEPIINELPVYAVVNKSLDANNPPPDVMPAEEDLSVSQSKQSTDVDVIY